MSAPRGSLRFQSLAKSYGSVVALRDVSFEVEPGTVHALLGENGAGKSTLLRILSGAHPPTAGSLAIDGVEMRFGSTAESIRAGVAVIQQELQLVPELTVAENIFLGHLPAKRGVVDRRELRARAAELLHTLGEATNPGARLASLSLAQRQMVEIAKALSRRARIIAFDEPTSSLSAAEIDRLFRVIADLRRDGRAIVYVSHRMEEIFRLCDAGTVLRDGRHVSTRVRLRDATATDLIRDMVGRDLTEVFAYAPRPIGGPALEVSDLQSRRMKSAVSLSVGAGEVLGLFGLIGAGRTELLRAVFGADPLESGEIRLHGRRVEIRRPGDAIDAGIVYCTEDRKRDGIVPMLSVQDNLNLFACRRAARAGGVIDESWERANAARQIQSLGIRTAGAAQPIRHLSGGNQQKVILGRWFSSPIKVLLLDEPTRGIDVGAKAEIYRLIFRLAGEGLAIVVVSSDLPEVLGLADRVVVLRAGAVSAVFSRNDATPERVLERALPVATETLHAHG